MRNPGVRLAIIFVIFGNAVLFADDKLSVLVESALSRAGDNTAQLRKALDEVDGSQKEGMNFLIAYMPDRDLKSLSAEFLLNNVKFAYEVWDKSPWKAQVPKNIFLNDVLPYASINERRDDWRGDFYRRFMPLIAQAKSPGEAAVILNREIFKKLDVRFSRKRIKADQSPYETIESHTASCTGMSVLLIDACRAVGIPARFAGTPLWANKSGNHSWVEIWDDGWHYTGGGEPSGDKLDKAWFTAQARTAQKDHRLHAIYAASYKHTAQTFPLVWDRNIDYVYAVNVTDRYMGQTTAKSEKTAAPKKCGDFDVEASLHAVDQLKTFLETKRGEREPLSKQLFTDVALTQKDAETARQLLWADHVSYIKQDHAEEMKSRMIKDGKLEMPFYYKVFGEKPESGRSLYISLHGGGGAPKRVNDSQWNNQKKLYQIPEGVYLVPRAPTNTWNLWHQGHIDGMFDRLIENMIVFEDVNPNRVYVMGYSAGGDGVYQIGPRMADRWAAASMMAGHPNNASPVSLYNTPFTIHVGGKDKAYNRNTVARTWGDKLAELHKNNPGGYINWTKIYEDRGHWIQGGASDALPWMAKYTRNPLPERIIWRQDSHKRFYWLKEDKLRPGAVIDAAVKAQQTNIKPGDADELIV
ncbi:MAG: polyhydroxyalkanoate depolymerase, partial [Phycisphaerae bacterium]|nr:polyhydroxyalkanoate depolymerase [Phycisphaerae bacterium]